MPQEVANWVYVSVTQEPVALLMHGHDVAAVAAVAGDLGHIQLYH